MSEIGHVLLIMAILKRAEADAISDDDTVKYDALGFLYEYGIGLSRFVGMYLDAGIDLERRIRKILAGAEHDAYFRSVVNSIFVRSAIDRYGLKKLSLLTGLDQKKLKYCILTDDELKKVYAVVTEADKRIVTHVRDLMAAFGVETNVSNPDVAMGILKKLTTGELTFCKGRKNVRKKIYG